MRRRCERACLGGPFWRWWSASTAASLAAGIRSAAFPLLTASLTSDPRAVGAVAAVASVPWLLVGLAAGSWADRTHPARMAAAADAAGVVVLVGLLAAVIIDRVTIPMLVVASFVVGLAGAFRFAAGPVMVVRLVRRELLERANGRLQASSELGNYVVGPPIGAWLFGVAAALPLAIDGSAVTISVVLVLTLPITILARDTAPPRKTRALVREGLAWLRNHRVVRTATLCSGMLAIADGAWWSILALYTRQHLGLPPAAFGVLVGCGAVGGVLGAIGTEQLTRLLPRRVLFTLSALAAGLPAAGLAATQTAGAAAVFLAISSAGFGVWEVLVATQQQRLVPVPLIGRISTIDRTLTVAAGAAGALCGGFLATLDIRVPFLIAALVNVAAAAWMYHALAKSTD